MGAKTPAPSTTNKCRKSPPASGSRAPQTGSAELAPEEGFDPHARSWLRSLTGFLDFHFAIFRAISQVVHKQSDQPADHREVPKPLERSFPQLHAQWNVRILRQTAVEFRLRRIMQHVNNAGSAHARRIINPRLRKIKVITQLLRPLFPQILHVV